MTMKSMPKPARFSKAKENATKQKEKLVFYTQSRREWPKIIPFFAVFPTIFAERGAFLWFFRLGSCILILFAL